MAAGDGGEATGGESAGARAWLLVVEDDAGIRALLRDALTARGYRIQTAPDGAAALRLVQAAPPALILLDRQLPGLDGPAFAAAYRARPGPHAPILAMTATGDLEGYGRAIGAAAVLSKPFRLSELLARVEQCVAVVPGGS
jgi:DNA-binding response OmpR family regulator